MMKRYQELADGEITLQDLTDTELKELRKSWPDEAGNLLPRSDFWASVPAEQRRREIERASKPKPIDRGFYS
jgi:hypothetical protein